MPAPLGDYVVHVEGASIGDCPVTQCELDPSGSCRLMQRYSCEPSLSASTSWDGACAGVLVRFED
jgi:hypothetical protein